MDLHIAHEMEVETIPLEEKDSDSTIDSDVCVGGPDWSLLPDVLVVEVLVYLSDVERLQVSLVCRRWNLAFHHPCLWRVRYYHFGGIRSPRNEADRAIGFARSHGSYLRKLRVTCEHPSYTLCKKFQRSMATFLAALGRPKRGARCQLRDLTMGGLHLDRYWRYEYTRERLISSIARFLKMQRKLDVVDFQDVTCPIAGGLRLLEALAYGSGRHLTVLNMEDFFHSRLAVFQVGRFNHAMTKFRALKTIFTNYNYLSDEVLEILAACCARSLSTISIKICKHDPHFHRIQNMTWKKLRRACPMLKVNIYYEGIGSYDTIAATAPREVPLKSLQIWTGVHHNNDPWNLELMLRYVTDCFTNTLEEVCLGLENGREPVDEGLLYLLRGGRQLESLDVQAVLQVPTVQQLYCMQLQYKTGLLRCHINMENLTGIEMVDLETVNEEYQPMVEERGLDFIIQASEMPYF